MTTLSALYVVRNEGDLIKGSILRILPFVEEVIVVDNESTDNTLSEVESIVSEKIKIFHQPYVEPVDMGRLRNISLDKCTSEWYWQIDADEYYAEEDCRIIRNAVDTADSSIYSYRVGYYNMAWRPGWYQANFEHFPDRLYRKKCVEGYAGVLPQDMTRVVRPYYHIRPYLEYDNAEDKSFENKHQPILPAMFYHLARTRGYWYEYHKWFRYNSFIHPEAFHEELDKNTRINQWVSGQYVIDNDITVPEGIPLKNIKDPKVSVVITCYNYGQYLDECLRSVLAQTKQPYEIIVVDDGSTDDTALVLKGYSDHPLMKVITHDHNKGVCTARNGGMFVSTGDYILNLDADDTLEPTFIERVLPLMEGDVQVAFADMRVHFEDGTDYIHTYQPFSIEELRKEQCVPSVAAIIDRRAFEVSGGFDPNAIYDDYDFWLRLAVKHQFKFAQIHEPLFVYRRHVGSRCDGQDKRQEEGFRQLQALYGKVW